MKKMRTEHEINNDIIGITMEIQKKFPELAQYFTEMPVTIPDFVNTTVAMECLKDYNESLLVLESTYSKGKSIAAQGIYEW